MVLALWFLTMCLKPVEAAGGGTVEVITHRSELCTESSQRPSDTYKSDTVLSSRVLVRHQKK